VTSMSSLGKQKLVKKVDLLSDAYLDRFLLGSGNMVTPAPVPI
jgi:hypothetical protein